MRTAEIRAATAERPRIALIETRRVADLLAFEPRATPRATLTAGELFAAGGLLLLFVGAAGSVLRLSARVARDPAKERLAA